MKYDYTAVKEDELDIVVGDIIILTKTDDSGWWRGFRMRDTTKGWFPADYVVKVEEDDEPPAEESWDGQGEATADGGMQFVDAEDSYFVNCGTMN